MSAPSVESRPVVVREAVLDDCVPVSRMLHRLGLQFPDDAEEARQYWQWLWIDNPARLRSPRALPIGWVLESDSGPVGFFGNFPMQYRFGNKTLLAAVATSWGVEASFRTHTSELSRRYFSQTAADLLLGTTAGKGVGRIFGRFGMSPMPQAEYAEALYWILDPAGFLKAAFHRKELPRVIASAGAATLAPALSALLRMGGARPRINGAAVDAEQISLDDIDHEFDSLWLRKASDGRLYSYREAVDLRWHFHRQARAETLSVFRCRRGNRLSGYLIMVREEVPSISLRRAKIVDLFVASDDWSVIDSLVAAAAATAANQNCHLLEAVGFPPAVRLHLQTYRPFTRRFANFPIHFKALDPPLQTALLDRSAWYPTLYDGDSSLF